MHRWQLQEAKARFSEVVKSATTEGPQEISVRGEPMAVLLSVETYQRLVGQKPKLSEFLRHSPLKEVDLELDRDRSPAREVVF